MCAHTHIKCRDENEADIPNSMIKPIYMMKYLFHLCYQNASPELGESMLFSYFSKVTDAKKGTGTWMEKKKGRLSCCSVRFIVKFEINIASLISGGVSDNRVEV